MKKHLPILLLLAGMAIIPLFTQNPYFLGVWTFILINLFVVVGLDLLFGYTGQLSLGHGLFVSLGAYSSALLTTKAGWSGWLAMPIGILIAAVVGAMVAIPTLRLRGYYLAMATLGLPIVFEALVRVTSSFSGGSSGVISIPRLKLGSFALRDPVHYYYFVLILLVPVVVIAWRLANSRFGLELHAIHADETAATSRGVDVVRRKITVFVISAMMAALSGSLYVHYIQFVAPNTFGLHFSLNIVVLLVIGGMGRIWGGALGVIILTWVPELLRFTSSWQPVIFGILLVTIMLFSPSGIAGLLRRRPTVEPVKSGALKAPEHVAVAGQREPLLSVRNIRRSFGGVRAVDDVSFDIAHGQIKALIGPNGAGKSTALALVSGTLETDEGKIAFKGKQIEQLRADLRAHVGIGRTFQHARLISTLTVFENIALGSSATNGKLHEENSSIEIATAQLKRLGLEDVACCYPCEINQFQRRLTELGTALAGDPELLLLDEPAAGLSNAEIEQLGDFLKGERDVGRAILLVDHVMQLVLPLADEIVVMENGRVIAEGSTDEVFKNEHVQAAYLGRRK